MRSSREKAPGKLSARPLVLIALMCAVGSIPALAGAAVPALSSAQPVMAITVANNSSREIRFLYLSPVDQDTWGPDLLKGTVLRNGQTFTISDVSCVNNEIKVIAEDKDGCFMYGVVSCAQGITTWDITNDTPVDCGN